MDKGIALYIHIPFCKQKCLYCDFPSFCGMESQMIDYAKALSKEIDNIGEETIKTIFIGGGTPTYLSLEGWNIIGKSIHKLKKSIDLEFTVEGNPGTFDMDKLKIFKSIGVNRISIGLQAWQNKHLKNLGRIHTNEEFVESFRMAREVGFENINIDLMFGIPNQNIHEWKETLNKVTELNPEHLSCYSLIVEEGTEFFKLYEREKLSLPEEELEREMYWYTLEFLKKKGFNQYEISNFCKKNKECKHNLVYWNLKEYIGCGSSAHGYKDGVRYRNEEKVEEYIRLISHKKNAIVEKKENSIEDDMEEYMFMGLRKINGISINEFEDRFKTSIHHMYETAILSNKNKGLLEENQGRLFLSPKGIEVSNIVMSDFIISD